MSADVTTLEEFKVKVEELQLLINGKLAELEEDSSWGTEEERAEVVVALDELWRDNLDENGASIRMRSGGRTRHVRAEPQPTQAPAIDATL